MNTVVDKPAVHEDSGRGGQDARDLEVETVFRVRGGLVRAVFHEAGTVEVGDSAADDGAGDEAEACVCVQVISGVERAGEEEKGEKEMNVGDCPLTWC